MLPDQHKIVLTSEYGKLVEGIVSEAGVFPGMALVIDAVNADGYETGDEKQIYKKTKLATDAEQSLIAIEYAWIGRTIDDAYGKGERIAAWAFKNGDRALLRVVAGTYAKGDVLASQANGTFAKGTPATGKWVCQEDYVAVDYIPEGQTTAIPSMVAATLLM
jgi:hypothetical protein